MKGKDEEEDTEEEEEEEPIDESSVLPPFECDEGEEEEEEAGGSIETHLCEIQLLLAPLYAGVRAPPTRVGKPLSGAQRTAKAASTDGYRVLAGPLPAPAQPVRVAAAAAAEAKRQALVRKEEKAKELAALQKEAELTGQSVSDLVKSKRFLRRVPFHTAQCPDHMGSCRRVAHRTCGPSIDPPIVERFRNY